MLRIVEQGFHRAAFHDASGVHDHDLIGDFGNHAQIVGDQNHRCAGLGLQVGDQRENLCLNGDVQRSRRFVRYDQRRVIGQRHGNHGPLPHASREFMRVGVQPLASVRHADFFQHVQSPLAGSLV